MIIFCNREYFLNKLYFATFGVIFVITIIEEVGNLWHNVNEYPMHLQFLYIAAKKCVKKAKKLCKKSKKFVEKGRFLKNCKVKESESLQVEISKNRNIERYKTRMAKFLGTH